MKSIEELKEMTFYEIIEYFITVKIKKEQLVKIIDECKIPLDENRHSKAYYSNRVADWLCKSG